MFTALTGINVRAISLTDLQDLKQKAVTAGCLDDAAILQAEIERRTLSPENARALTGLRAFNAALKSSGLA